MEDHNGFGSDNRPAAENERDGDMALYIAAAIVILSIAGGIVGGIIALAR